MKATGIEIGGLQFGYGHTPIFRNLSFSTSSRVTVIQGPSGCGKTTLLKLIDGVLVAPPPATIDRPSPSFLVLQSIGIAPWLTGRENMELFSRDLWPRVQASDLFPLIEHFADRPAHSLSFGQRRSIELLRALVSGYPLLLLDEPLNFLDRARRETIMDYIGDTRRCQSQIIMTTHYDDAAALSAVDTFEFAGDPPYAQLLKARHP